MQAKHVLRRIVELLVVASALFAGLAHAINWNYLDGPFGGQPTALYTDLSGTTWAGMNGGGAFYREAGSSTWRLAPGLITQSNYQFAMADDGTLYVSGSGGVYMLDGPAGTWVEASGQRGLPGQAGGGLATSANGAIYAGMNNTGAVYTRLVADEQWTVAGTGLPAGSNVDLLAFDAAGNLWGSIYGVGVYKLPAGGSTWTEVGTGLTSKTLQALIAVGNDLFAGTGGNGVFKLANASTGGMTWSAWNGGSLGASEGVYGFAVGADNVLYAAGYGKAFALASGASTWTLVGTGLTQFGQSYAIVYSAVDGTLSIGNGSGVVDLADGETLWQLSLDGMTSSGVYSVALAPNGDLYAATFGQGVARLAPNASTWTTVDFEHMSPVVQSVVVDALGTVYAAGGGAVKKLVNGQWADAGTNLASFVTTLVVDAQNTLWAGQGGAVQKLAAGTPAWVSVGTGLPGDSVNSIVFDAAGNVYAGIYQGGVYRLAAGSTVWTALNDGLPDLRVLALARSATNDIYAGTGHGVYKLAGTAWTLAGTGLADSIYALAVDASGDVYAGVDNGYAWRLPAGSSQWTQILLGLTPRTVQFLIAAGGRVYAGTDASRGSPSGVYVLSQSETVVEFYNSILDHFFITATAAEQAAILNGSAGPGWSATGNVFSVGGPALVCRFYGSISPGPNSHFYTIDPAECQLLKDIQAQTPSSLKRWNFESNDFASTRPTNGQCPANTIAVYRAYNDGFAQGIDSNHRITSNQTDYLIQVAKGWTGEGVVMCAAR